MLRENGIQPAPGWPSSWRTFLRAHWGESADFFTTEVWTPRGLVTYYIEAIRAYHAATGDDGSIKEWLKPSMAWAASSANG